MEFMGLINSRDACYVSDLISFHTCLEKLRHIDLSDITESRSRCGGFGGHVEMLLLSMIRVILHDQRWQQKTTIWQLRIGRSRKK